jgi:LPXTG-motif cell wall-anchored protein
MQSRIPSRWLLTGLAVLGLALGGGGRALADITALTYTPGSGTTDPVGTNPPNFGPGTYGWQFSVTANFTVTALGFNFQGGAITAPANQVPTQVGIWLADGGVNGGLVVSATVLPTDGGLDANGFRYSSALSGSGQLLSGHLYRIGAAMLDPGELVTQAVAGLHADTNLSYLSGAVDTSSPPHFTFPGTLVPGTNGFFGPNFQFAPPVATPEPSAFVLSGLLAMGGLGYWWRKRKRSALPAT